MNSIDTIKSFQHVSNLLGMNNLIENGIKDTRTNEVIDRVLIKVGAHNELVRFIQQRLNALGFNCGKTGADSYFGVSTLAAVKHFQFLYGLISDGVIGPLTIAQLLK